MHMHLACQELGFERKAPPSLTENRKKIMRSHKTFERSWKKRDKF